MLKTLHEALQAAAVEMKVVAAHGDVRDMLRAEGLEDRLGLIDRRNSVADLVDEFHSRKGMTDETDAASHANG